MYVFGGNGEKGALNDFFKFNFGTNYSFLSPSLSVSFIFSSSFSSSFSSYLLSSDKSLQELACGHRYLLVQAKFLRRALGNLPHLFFSSPLSLSPLLLHLLHISPLFFSSPRSSYLIYSFSQAFSFSERTSNAGVRRCIQEHETRNESAF